MNRSNRLPGEHNRTAYDALDAGDYSSTAPHLQHHSIWHLYEQLLDRALSAAGRSAVGGGVVALDLGAGDGVATRPLLARGANVVAVDISEKQLAQLRDSCVGFPGQLEVRCEDVNVVLEESRRYQIVVANSFLHHVLDYLALIDRAVMCVEDGGVLFTFQDPVRKRSMSRRDAWFTAVTYDLWRLTQPDLLGGLFRRLRRLLGFWSESSRHDMTEYHAIRDGVDQDKLSELLRERGFECEIVRYTSCQGSWFQWLGERIGVLNTFSIIAVKR